VGRSRRCCRAGAGTFPGTQRGAPRLTSRRTPARRGYPRAYAASGAIDYVVPISGDIRLKFPLNANHAQATQGFDQFATKADFSFIVNGRINLSDVPLGSAGGPKLTVGQWVRLGDYGNFNPPRTLGIDAAVKF